jgi:hypothetical protein
MAKATRQPKETSLPVIIALVFFIITTIGLGVFVYVLFSDQEAKDAQVVTAKKEVTDMRATVKDAELTARLARIMMGIPEGSGDTSDLVIVQNEVKEGSKPYQQLLTWNKNLKDRGPQVATEVAGKWDATVEAYLKSRAAGGMTKIDSSTLFSPPEFDVWNGELDASTKQLMPPKRTLLEIASRAATLRNFSMKAIADEQASYESVLKSIQSARTAADMSQKAYTDKAVELPKNFDAKIAKLQMDVDTLRANYQKAEAATRAEVAKKQLEIEAKDLEIRTLQNDAKSLRENISTLLAKTPKTDPFAYDEPKGKITARLADNIVEINLGSNAHVEPGLTFTILPIDFPQKGRQSRMLKFRLPNEKGVYRDVEMFMPKASIEVIEVIGPDVSRARITQEHDDVRDRALPGDLLYNSVWRKGQADHIALVGIFDLNGDGTDDIENLVRDLNKMGIPVDAYMDLRTGKWVGKLTERTRYIVDGAVPVPLPSDPHQDAKVRMIGWMKAGKDEGGTKNIQVVPARDFFGRIGYKAKADVSDDHINQAAAKYLNAMPAPVPEKN